MATDNFGNGIALLNNRLLFEAQSVQDALLIGCKRQLDGGETCSRDLGLRVVGESVIFVVESAEAGAPLLYVVDELVNSVV